MKADIRRPYPNTSVSSPPHVGRWLDRDVYDIDEYSMITCELLRGSSIEMCGARGVIISVLYVL